jgi:hypothetical protein
LLARKALRFQFLSGPIKSTIFVYKIYCKSNPLNPINTGDLIFTIKIALL